MFFFLPAVVLALTNVERLFEAYLDRYGWDLGPEEREDAFSTFSMRLKKHGAEDAKDLDHLAELVTHTDGRATYGLTSYFAFNKLPTGYLKPTHTYIDVDPSTGAQTEKPCTHSFHRPDPFPVIEDTPPSVDLRELGLLGSVLDQGSCGSCWAHGSAASLESSVRSTRHLFKDNPDVDPLFKDPEFVASAQYIMNNSRTNNNYCEGGNYEYVSVDYANGVLDTVESRKNFPLTSDRTGVNPPYIEPAQTHLTKLFSPFHTDGTKFNCNLSIIELFNIPSGKIIRMRDIQRLRSWLARGLAIPTLMNTQGGGPNGQISLGSYRSGILDYPCQQPGVFDHQVVYVGYGKFHGVDVWLLRNSWGEDWGLRGFFMTPVRGNSFCTETAAYIDVPKYYDFALNGTAYQRQADASTYWDDYVRRDTEAGFDSD
ncbi:Cathepsin L [Giardia muris]|uniref:Cathepsin L n=1 Tax=Giardia muris TaxID=5742 RepID=A0A4Z1T852_GIAMU|nr:Cathepsin L [Giardia muris]|eukprot:TNJ28759.1 Cathepsin L [Giardia muris]